MLPSDGGFVGRYNLRSGWSSSYPETTGYIIPTLLRLADTLGDDDYFKRAERAIEFLLSVQLPSGAFPGAEIAENRTNPSPFNTGQIMHGLQAWTKRTGDERCRTALFRAGRWLCEIQDPSGAWLKFFYQELATTYSAHLTCWLAEAGEFLSDEPMLQASSRHLAWVMRALRCGALVVQPVRLQRRGPCRKSLGDAHHRLYDLGRAAHGGSREVGGGQSRRRERCLRRAAPAGAVEAAAGHSRSSLEAAGEVHLPDRQRADGADLAAHVYRATATRAC